MNQTNKMMKTRLKSVKSKNGLNELERTISDLTLGISLAQGALATLELGHLSRSTKKFQEIHPQHLLILLQDATEGISIAEKNLSHLITLMPILLA